MRRVPELLAISSGGGHWVELLRLRPAFAGYKVTYATVSRSCRSDIRDAPFTVIPDCSAGQILRVLWSGIAVLALLLRLRPDVVVSTGAAPGCLALMIGRLLGADTIWVDSLANAERLSLAGRIAGRYARLWLTQWPHLASENGPEYRGSVL